MALPLFGIAVFLMTLQLLEASSAHDDLVVLTKKGRVRGLPVSVPGGEVSAFLGIPYAEPPLRSLRFKRPVPSKAWQGVLETTRFSPACFQPVDTSFPGFLGVEMWNPNMGMSEDCLYLNVWVPQPRPHLAPVMVWIYGGGFTTGTTSLSMYDGRFLSHTEGVVVVSMNYRLGPLGFLVLQGSADVRGNMGLFDQRLALQWVAENIEAFGGDPQSVTLFGESAGAGAIGFHLLSQGSHNLFTRAILQSGSVNAPWAIVPPQEAWNRSLELARLLGCPLDARIETCLRNVPPNDLVNRQFEVVKIRPLISIAFPPTIDSDFLSDLPEALLQVGRLKKADLLLGLTRDEGTFFLVYGAPGFSITNESLITREDFLKGVEATIPSFSQISQEAVVFQYTDWTDEFSGEKNRNMMNHIVSDYYFSCPMLDFSRKSAAFGSRVFMYFFEHRSSRNPWPKWMGVMHGEEIEFVFGLPLNSSLGYTKEEEAMSRRMMKHWATFARTGNPNSQGSEWPPFTAEKQEYISLNTDVLKVQRMLKAQKCKLWDSFLSKLEVITVGMDKAELQWKSQFQRWYSYMLDWRNQFAEYSARKQQCVLP
ncbi:cholinesterase-like [Scleropages formosus]|nr:cholinesterase [Scleropages formosus]XP_029111570.1 cholinesterase [Scleropages formosus]XP_029111571.1 cholinesterase [Scleropages formosus]